MLPFLNLDPLGFITHWTNYWLNFFDLNKKPKIDHRNAKYKVIKVATNESVYFSNASDIEKAKEEGWTAFNINKSGVRKSQTGVDFIVIENPHRMIDDDGYDTVTGLKLPIEGN